VIGHGLCPETGTHAISLERQGFEDFQDFILIAYSEGMV
jgi:hypothetical protein